VGSQITLPHAERPPLLRLGSGGLALAVLTAVALLVYIGRDGYVDAEEDGVSLLDAFYYATVSVTTTGYGDIRPVSDPARLLNILLVTPARVLFLILLVGTTLELLAERTREGYLLRRWRKSLRDHVVICGFGAKGRSALRTLTVRGIPVQQVVVIDDNPLARQAAAGAGAAVVSGDARRGEVLELAEVQRARAVIVAPERDDASVLITLAARRLAPHATIVSGAREEENVPLLRQSGADSVIVSSGAAGRLLGLATETPQVADVLEDLLTVGQGLDLGQRIVAAHEAGPIEQLAIREPVVAVVRDGLSLRFDDPRAAQLRPGDCIVFLHSRNAHD
jgi:voltage-gated potassium channel